MNMRHSAYALLSSLAIGLSTPFLGITASWSAEADSIVVNAAPEEAQDVAEETDDQDCDQDEPVLMPAEQPEDGGQDGDKDEAEEGDSRRVEVRVMFIAFNPEAIENLLVNGKRVDVGSLRDIWKDGGGKLICAPTLLTSAGQEACLKRIQEFIYPTEYCVQGGGSGARCGECALVPSGFETREVGIILVVLPQVREDDGTISLNINADIVDQPDWFNYGSASHSSSGKVWRSDMKMPFFKRTTFSTLARVANGEEVIVSGGVTSSDGKQIIYAIACATLIVPAGEPVKDDTLEEEEDESLPDDEE